MPDNPQHNPAPSTGDPLIDEVRALKLAASERFGHDLARIAEELRRIEEANKSKVVQPPPSTQAPGRVA